MVMKKLPKNIHNSTISKGIRYQIIVIYFQRHLSLKKNKDTELIQDVQTRDQSF